MTLKYTEGRQPVISGMSRVSRPGRRTYVDHGEIPKVQGGMGTTIVSTSKGVMTGHEAKRRASAAKSWRTSGDRRCLESANSPSPCPTGVDRHDRARGRARQPARAAMLEERKPRDIGVEQQDSELVVTRPTDRGEHRALHGLTRSLIFNMVQGVTEGYTKRLEIQGVGYRAALKGRDIELQVGYSHPVPIKAPEGIEFEVPVPTQIIVKGNSKQAVGEIAARIRKVRPPEPYKGKGIRYAGEYVARKVGKRA